MTKLLPRLGLLMIGLLLPLVLVELALRLFGPILPGNYELGTWREPHPVYRRFHVPGGHAWLRTPEYITELRFNQFGLRNDHISQTKPAGATRILLLGDSFVESVGVPRQDTAAAQLEMLLRQSGRPSAEVLNAGVYGWGPAEEYLYLKEEGLSFEPNVVVVVFYIGNDISNNFPRGRDELRNLAGPAFQINNAGQLEALPWRLSAAEIGDPLSAELRHRLFTFRAYETGVIYKFQYDATDLTARRLSIYRNRESRDVSEAWKVIDALIGAMHQETARVNAQMLLVIAPTKWQVHDEDWAEVRAEQGIRDLDDWNLALPNTRLAELATRRGIPVLDLLPPMRQAASQGTRLYFPLDGHWNTAGNHFTAQAIHQALESAALLPH